MALPRLILTVDPYVESVGSAAHVKHVSRFVEFVLAQLVDDFD